MIKLISLITCFFILSCFDKNVKIKDKNKGIVLDKDLKRIPDSFVGRIQDTGLIKIGYNSKLSTKLFEYIYLNDISFDSNKLQLNILLKDLPYKLNKKEFSNGADEDYLVLQTHCYFTEKSYLIQGGEKGKEIAVGIIINDSSINNSIYNIRVGDSIIKINHYFYISRHKIEKELDDDIKDKIQNFGTERFVDIYIYENKEKMSDYFLRYIWDIYTKKIVRIEVKFNDL